MKKTLFVGQGPGIWTGEGFVRGMLVNEDGRIEKMYYSDVETWKISDAERIVLPGIFTMPGIRDNHTHWLFELVGNAMSVADTIRGNVDPASNFLLALSGQLDAQPSGTVVFTDWDNSVLSENVLRGIVGQVNGENQEVLILNKSWHSAYASPALLRRVMPEIESIRQKFGLQGNCRDGMIDEDYVIQTIARLEFDRGKLKDRLMARQRLLLSKGITSIYDKMVLGMPLFETLSDLSMRGELIIPTTAAIQPWMMDSVRPGQYGHFLQVKGLKFFADGAFGNRKARMCFGAHNWAYNDGSVGEDLLPAWVETRRIVERWRHMGGEDVLVHAIGPGAVVETANLFEAVLSDRELSTGLTLGFEHMEACPPSVINRVAELQRSGAKVQVCSQPGFSDDLAAYTDRLPLNVLEMINPYWRFKREGLRWSFGTDGPITGDRVFTAFAQAINREDGEAISVSDMLGAAIERPLREGGPFTAICLNADCLSFPQNLKDVEVLATYIGGKRVWEKKG